MNKLFLLRHQKSQWNGENRFSGWVDNPLNSEGRSNSKAVARKLDGETIDVVYCSRLIRNLETVLRLYEERGKEYPIFKHFNGKMKEWGSFEGNGNYVPVYVTDDLNERYYGTLQGLDKAEIIKKYGEEQVHLWRRAFTAAPPSGESMKDTHERAVPFFQQYPEKDLKEGKNVLVVGSHNPLRAIMKYLENISDEEIIGVEIPFGGMLLYTFESGVMKSKELL